MSKAEEAALKAYPTPQGTTPSDNPWKKGRPWQDSDMNLMRIPYIKGYKQAEKDLALTWQDIQTIAKIFHNLVFTISAVDPVENIYEEVLKRFNKYKEVKNEDNP